ncbi:hypothetical protein ISG33_02590 [Glaciecola sp. MH2013]|uniref:hypothetical protein n=1 Tax=Glaciecola sp. MH2013 TaxID=2785524 RepID=UPI00189EA355|nr:hypothetical protein [Glaciecola sp. MH2013]MBF7072290.1 hypothetical protein [Glaciecola sp. MH2013]
MNLTAIIIVAICVGGITKIIDTLARNKRKKSDNFANEDKEALLLQIKEMNERIQTLERIVTDEKYSLNKEFENLRREPAA